MTFQTPALVALCSSAFSLQNRRWQSAKRHGRKSACAGVARQFGVNRLLTARVVLPDDNCFPDPYDGKVDDARRLLDRICDFMQIAPASIRLEVCEDTAMPGAAGQYQPGLVRLAESQLADPPGVVAVLAHELRTTCWSAVVC